MRNTNKIIEFKLKNSTPISAKEWTLTAITSFKNDLICYVFVYLDSNKDFYYDVTNGFLLKYCCSEFGSNNLERT